MADITIDPEIRDLIPPLTEAERAELEASLLVDGCRDALSIWESPDGPVLLDGHHRKAICDHHGLDYRLSEIFVFDREKAMLWVIANQRGRRNLSHFARGELALRALEIEKVRAKRRQGARTDIGAKLPTSGRARDRAAATMDISGTQLGKVRFLVDNADDETKARLRAGETSVHREHVRLKRDARKAEARKAVESKPQPMPDGPFDVIVADPPWSYFLRADDALHRGRVPYPAMSTQQICDLQVAKIAADDCILWLWTTNALLHDAFHVCEAWGFECKTVLTWAKPSAGVGHWLRGATEHCLMCTKGKPVHDLKGQSTLLNAPRREHSRKPDQFFQLVEGLCPGSKVELFAREPRDGWASWGAEKDKFKSRDEAAERERT
jgi:N6-adenosine-specific RNA methylase IME4